MWSVGLAALLSAAACSSDSGDDDGGDEGGAADDGGGADDGADGADDGSDGGGDGVIEGEQWTVEWGPVMVAPATEATQCIFKRLPADRELKIGQIINDLGSASHHMIVYRLADGEETQGAPEDCDPFVDVLDPSKGAPLAVTQKSDETITLPRGVAFSLEPNQLIRIELHYVNATDEPQELRASSTFVELPAEDFEQEADFMFVGNPDINLKPMSSATLDTPFLPLPAELAGVQIFAVTGHEHQWGTGVTASIVTSEDDPGVAIYEPENFQWDEPETIYHDPPMAMPEGGGFRFSCSWNNLSEGEVGFGESVDDEMCFFWAYYYPSQGSQICFHTDQFGGQDLCCPDNPLCELIGEFLDMQ
jgi:hypothetical protein